MPAGIGAARLIVALALFALLIASGLRVSWAEPLPPGVGHRVLDVGGASIEVHTYKPVNYSRGALLVSFHGLGRDVARYREATQAIAERTGMLVIVPLLDRERFPYWRYQALGITRQSRRVTEGPIPVKPRDEWTSGLILKLIDRVRRDEGAPELDYYLIGHSAGAQIVNRLAAFAPNQAKRIVVTNPSSYVAPTRAARFPYGFGDLPPEFSDDDNLRRYLAQPVTFFLGTADVSTRDLDMLPPAMQQGERRYQRGHNVFRMAQTLARERGWEFNWRLVEVPGVAHDVRRMYGSPQASAALFPER